MGSGQWASSGDRAGHGFPGSVSTLEPDAPQQSLAIRSVIPFLAPLLLSVLLITAALAKLAWLPVYAPLPAASTPLPSLSFTNAPAFQAMLAALELVLAVLLLTGFLPRLTRCSSVALLSIFVLYSAISLFAGAESCGCWGSARVSPGVMLAVDALLLTSLILFPPRYLGELLRTHVRLIASGAAIGVLTITAVAFASGNVISLASVSTSSSERMAKGSVVVLNPDDWVGSEFPLFHEFEVGGSNESLEQLAAQVSMLRSGEWTVLFVHAGCPDCERELALLAAETFSDGTMSDAQLCLIEIPPFGDQDWQSAIRATQRNAFRLRRDVEWFAATPQRVKLSHGNVVADNSLPKQ